MQCVVYMLGVGFTISVRPIVVRLRQKYNVNKLSDRWQYLSCLASCLAFCSVLRFSMRMYKTSKTLKLDLMCY